MSVLLYGSPSSRPDWVLHSDSYISLFSTSFVNYFYSVHVKKCYKGNPGRVQMMRDKDGSWNLSNIYKILYIFFIAYVHVCVRDCSVTFLSFVCQCGSPKG